VGLSHLATVRSTGLFDPSHASATWRRPKKRNPGSGLKAGTLETPRNMLNSAHGIKGDHAGSDASVGVTTSRLL
jgi:hypothetical protein